MSRPWLGTSHACCSRSGTQLRQQLLKRVPLKVGVVLPWGQLSNSCRVSARSEECKLSWSLGWPTAWQLLPPATHWPLQSSHMAVVAELCSVFSVCAVLAAGSCNLAHELRLLLEAFQTPTAAPAPSAHPASSLDVAQAAHQVLLQQALLLRGRLPIPVSASSAAARPRSAAAATRSRSPVSCSQQSRRAQDVLCFLKSHAQSMLSLLHTLPDCATSPPRSRGGSPDMQPQCQQHAHGQSHHTSAQEGHISEGAMQSSADNTDILLGPAHAARQPPAAAAPWPSQHRSQSAAGRASPMLYSLPARLAAHAVGVPLAPARPSTTVAGGWRAAGAEQGARRAVGYPDLTPYLRFPPMRPSSPAGSSGRKQQQSGARPASPPPGSAGGALSDSVMTELQEALAEREGQLQQQHRQCWQLNKQLQAALQQLANAEAQLVATDAQAVAATSASAALQQQLTAAEQAAAGAAEANAALLQQLGAAQQAAALVQEQLKQKEWEMQGLLSSHTAAVLDSAVMELQLEEGLASQDTLEGQESEAQQLKAQLRAAEAALQGLQQQLHAQASQQGTDVHAV